VKIKLRDGAIYQACKNRDISRDELSRQMRVATSTAYRVERGDVEPSPRFIASLMKLTGKKFEDLFEIVDDEAA
jgi:transcriptional regulator with XRE-family HTH domain